MTASTHAPGDGIFAQRAAQALGLTPDALACIDVHGSEPATVYSRIVDERDSYQQLEAYQLQLLDQQRIVHEAKSILRDAAENAEAQSALEHAETEVARLNSLIQNTRSGLITTILIDLADFTLVHEILITDGRLASLPPAYRLAVSAPDDAKDLAWALQMRDRAEAVGTSINSDAEQILLQAEGQYDVQLALTRMNSYADSNESSIQQWMLAN